MVMREGADGKSGYESPRGAIEFSLSRWVETDASVLRKPDPAGPQRGDLQKRQTRCGHEARDAPGPPLLCTLAQLLPPGQEIRIFFSLGKQAQDQKKKSSFGACPRHVIKIAEEMPRVLSRN